MTSQKWLATTRQQHLPYLLCRENILGLHRKDSKAISYSGFKQNCWMAGNFQSLASYLHFIPIMHVVYCKRLTGQCGNSNVTSFFTKKGLVAITLMLDYNPFNTSGIVKAWSSQFSQHLFLMWYLKCPPITHCTCGIHKCSQVSYAQSTTTNWLWLVCWLFHQYQTFPYYSLETTYIIAWRQV